MLPVGKEFFKMDREQKNIVWEFRVLGVTVFIPVHLYSLNPLTNVQETLLDLLNS